jgi:hypothetical protein
VERGAELALAERQHYYCYQLYTNCKHQDQSWRDPRWVVPGYFPHPGWRFCWGVYGIDFRSTLVKPDIALKHVEIEMSCDQSSDDVFWSGQSRNETLSPELILKT